MANKWPLATGVWSNAANWNDGTLPTSADDVYADGKTVTIDQNVTVLTIRTTQRTGGTAGGGFIANNGVTISATAATNGVIPGSTTALTLAANAVVTLNAVVAASATTAIAGTNYSSGSLTINGSIGLTFGQRSATAVQVTGTGSLTVTGAVYGVYDAPGILFASTGALSITGDITGANSGISGNAGIGVNITTVVPSSVTVIGNITGRSLSSASVTGGVGLQCGVAAVLNVTGQVQSGSNSLNPGIATTNGLLNIIGPVVANGVTVAVSVNANNLNSLLTMTGPFVTSAVGFVTPFLAYRVRLSPTTGKYFEFRDTTGANGNAVRWYSPDVVADSPAVGNVRLGTTYANGTLTGTLAVPPANTVSTGIPVDNTVGTAVLTPSALAALIGAQIAAAVSSPEVP